MTLMFFWTRNQFSIRLASEITLAYYVRSTNVRKEFSSVTVFEQEDLSTRCWVWCHALRGLLFCVMGLNVKPFCDLITNFP